MRKEGSEETLQRNMVKILNIGIEQEDLSILHGWARQHLDLLKHKTVPCVGVYALLHPDVDKKQKLISIDLWNDPKIKVAGEEYVSDDHPLIKKLACLLALEICEE